MRFPRRGHRGRRGGGLGDGGQGWQIPDGGRRFCSGSWRAFPEEMFLRKEGAQAPSLQRHHVVLSPAYPISALGPGFSRPPPRSPNHQPQIPVWWSCARLLRKQSASGMLCCTLGTKSGLPWWLHGKQPACQRRRCRRRRFDPWVGKIPWRREWLPTPVFLPRKFHGQRSLEGYSPWG